MKQMNHVYLFVYPYLVFNESTIPSRGQPLIMFFTIPLLLDI